MNVLEPHRNTVQDDVSEISRNVVPDGVLENQRLESRNVLLNVGANRTILRIRDLERGEQFFGVGRLTTQRRRLPRNDSRRGA